jgi:hypothetical protein
VKGLKDIQILLLNHQGGSFVQICSVFYDM